MLRLAAEGKPIRVVDDQFGAPTTNLMIADAVPRVIRSLRADPALGGIYHVSAAGETTWYQFALEIFQVTRTRADVRPISSDQFAVRARRPRNSVLNNEKLAVQLGMHLPGWQEGLPQVLQALR